ncbi:MAG TPA: 5'-nucleotidase, partial [Candidatus Saccharimonadia bacterium]|nr:5'-nucleotidase [Candidatus Saccharimonadia bacterium]
MSEAPAPDTRPLNERDSRLVVAISSRALFDLGESHELFEQQGLDAYRRYQIARENDVLGPGIAFPLVQKL